MTGDITTLIHGRPGLGPSPEDPPSRPALSLPPMVESHGPVVGQGETFSVVGTNVVRVPFGIRQPRRTRPARPDHWATLVIPFQQGPNPTPPPRAA